MTNYSNETKSSALFLQVAHYDDAFMVVTRYGM